MPDDTWCYGNCGIPSTECPPLREQRRCMVEEKMTAGLVKCHECGAYFHPVHATLKNGKRICVVCAIQYEPEPGPDWVTDEPPWGQEDTSPETAEKRKQDWDRWYDGQDLPE